jgi:putative membrane protein
MQVSTIALILVATLHAGFFVLESVLWTSPKVRRIFGTTKEEAQATRVLALNQGFYNLGAAALLVWFHTIDNTTGVMGVLLFLASMGLVGAITANWRIILFQSVPAIAAFVLLYTL